MMPAYDTDVGSRGPPGPPWLGEGGAGGRGGGPSPPPPDRLFGCPAAVSGDDTICSNGFKRPPRGPQEGPKSRQEWPGGPEEAPRATLLPRAAKSPRRAPKSRQERPGQPPRVARRAPRGVRRAFPEPPGGPERRRNPSDSLKTPLKCYFFHWSGIMKNALFQKYFLFMVRPGIEKEKNAIGK